MQKETKFKEKVRKQLDTIPNSHFEKIQQLALRGTPDFLGVVNSNAVALELKVDSPLEKLQEYKTRKWKKAGAYTAIVTPRNLSAVVKDLMVLAKAPTFE